MKYNLINADLTEEAKGNIGDIEEYVSKFPEKKQEKERSKYFKVLHGEIARLERERKRQDKLKKQEDKMAEKDRKRQDKLKKQEDKMAEKDRKRQEKADKKKKQDDKDSQGSNSDIKPALDVVIVTDEANIKLFPCTVNDDHTIEYKGTKEKKKVKILRAPHVLEIPSKIFPGVLSKYLLGPKLRYRVYTVQKEGEVTHDPHLDDMDTETKMRLEKLLETSGKMMKADFAGKIAEGMKDSKSWEEYIPWVVIGLVSIVGMLLLSGALG